MSSYTCENFQLFIIYNFEFHYMVLKQLPEDLNPIFDIFEQSDVFFFPSSSVLFFEFYKIVDPMFSESVTLCLE